MGKAIYDALSAVKLTAAEVQDIAYSAQRTATFTVAASNATQANIDAADYQASGAVDDVQWQAALTALPTNGGLVMSSEGIYSIANSIELTHWQSIIGQGKHATKFVLAADVSMFTIKTVAAGGSGNWTKSTIAELWLEGNSCAYSNTSHAMNFSSAIADQSISEIVVRDVFIQNFKGAALYLDETQDGFFQRIFIDDCGDFAGTIGAIHCTGATYDSHSHFYGMTIHLTNTYHNAYGAIVLKDSHAKNNYFVNTKIEHRGDTYGILITGRNNRFLIGRISTQDALGNSIYFSTADAYDNKFSDWRIIGPGAAEANGQGIYLGDADQSNNVFRDMILLDLKYPVYVASSDCVFDNVRSSPAVAKNLDMGTTANRTVIRNCDFPTIDNDGTNTVFDHNVDYVGSGETRSIRKIIDHADLTDNGDATAYIDFDDAVPAGSIAKAVQCDFTQAWNSDNTTTLTMMIGYVGDLDAFNLTADPGENAFNHTTDVFWGEGDCQAHIVSSEKTPRVTFTEDNDATNIISGAGAQGGVTVTITYMKA